MLKGLLTLFAVLTALNAQAVETIVDQPKGHARGLVVIVPAKKYLMKERLFSGMAKNLTKHGFVVVRFNWSEDTLENPKLELLRAARDIKSIVIDAQSSFGFDATETVIISKSFSTKAIEPSLKLARTHVLLTPNCSVEAPFRQSYWNVLQTPGIELKMVISVDDPYCNVDEIKHTLKKLHRLDLLATTQGDHNFVLSNGQTSETSYHFQDLVIRNVGKFIEGAFTQ